MRIAVTTPTGNVGRHVVAALVRAGVRPRVLLRDPGRLAPGIRDEVDAVRGDQYDAEAVVAATRDIDALYWVDPSSRRGPARGLRPRHRRPRARGHREPDRTRRLPEQRRRGEAPRRREIDGLADTETALDAIGVDVTHLRCGYFFTNLDLQLDAVRAGPSKWSSRSTRPWPGSPRAISRKWP